MAMSMSFWAKKVVATKIVAADGSGDFDNIQDAINDLPAGGGVVYIKEGTYTITDSITITKSNVELRGAGRATEIKVGNGADKTGIVIGDGANAYTGIVVAELYVNGNKANQTAIDIDGIFLSSLVTESRIINCWVSSAKRWGIGLSGTATDCIVSKCFCTNNNDSGIGIASSATTLKVTECISNSNAGDGITSSASTLHISGCITNNNSHSGIALHGLLQTVTGCTSVSNTWYGILIAGDWNIVQGSRIRSNGEHGIEVNAAKYNAIVGNGIGDNSQTTDDTYCSIYLENASMYNTMTGNTCSDTGIETSTLKHIKEEDNTNDYNIILGNICVKPGDSIEVAGANTISEHNQT